jgi:DinB superfamily
MSGGLDLSRLSPSDAVAALRSYPRRFRALLTSLDEDERADDLVHRPGPDGRSAVDHADHVARSIAILGEALRQVLVHDEPTLLPAVADDAAREWQMAAQPSSVEAALDFLDVECIAMADTVERTPADAWTRTGTVAGSGPKMSALEIVREAVRTGATHLHAAERAIEAASRD